MSHPFVRCAIAHRFRPGAAATNWLRARPYDSAEAANLNGGPDVHNILDSDGARAFPNAERCARPMTGGG
jgi:hypothetical protein